MIITVTDLDVSHKTFPEISCQVVIRLVQISMFLLVWKCYSMFGIKIWCILPIEVINRCQMKRHVIPAVYLDVYPGVQFLRN